MPPLSDAVRCPHIGDLHLGPGPRNGDRLRALDTIIDENITDPQLGAWLFPGDVNHGRMTIEDRNALAVRLERMANAAPVVGCYGNHDLPGDLDIFTRIKARHGIIFTTRPSVVTVPLATGHAAAFFVLPYPTKAGLVSAGVAHDQLTHVGAEALEAIFRQGAATLDQARRQGLIVAMLGHVNVGGAVLSNGQPSIGHEIELNAGLLAMFGDDCYKGLNHIHKAQEIGGAWYPGSVCRLDWGEVDPKGYIVVEYHHYLEGGEYVRWNYTVQRRPLDVAPMYHVEGELTRGGFVVASDCGEDIERRFYANDWTGCEVRIRYRFAQSERAGLNHEAVADAFKTAARLKIEPIAMPDRGLRAPAVAEARTLREKADAWCAMTGTPLTTGLLDKLAQLEHRDGATVLTDVQASLDTAPAVAA